MTFHFARLAPPGATPRTELAARWLRCPLPHRPPTNGPVMHWDRPDPVRAIPAQHAPVPVAFRSTGARAA